MNKKELIIFAGLLTISSGVIARTLPHDDLVGKVLKSRQYEVTLKSCQGRALYASSSATGDELNCWVAKVASDLAKNPQAIVQLVFDDKARDAARFSCQSLSMEQRFKSVECANAGKAETFIEFRLPRTVESLKPLQFK